MVIIILSLLLACESLNFTLHTLQEPSLNISYYIELKIGQKIAKIGIDMSTDKSFLFSSQCNCTGSEIQSFPTETSDNSFQYTIKYKNIELTGMTFKYLIENKHKIKLFTVFNTSMFIKNFNFDGIIGLDYDDNQENTTFSEQLGKYLRYSNFGLVLKSSYNPGLEGFIEFGNRDTKDFFEGKKRRKDLENNVKNWKLHLSRVTLAENDIDLHTYVRFDVNIRGIVVPSKDYQNVLQYLPSQFSGINEKLEFNCDVLKRFSEFSLIFTIQRTKFPLRLDNLIEHGETCKLLLINGSSNYWIVGEPFFKDYYIRFSYNIKSIIFFQMDKFIPGFYELSIVCFVVLTFLVSLCGTWCMTSRKSSHIKLE